MCRASETFSSSNAFMTKRIRARKYKTLTADANRRSFAELGKRGQNKTSLPPEVVGDKLTPATDEAIHSADAVRKI